MGDVEAGHPERDPRLEDDRGGLRVGPDVELGGGRRVARAERAAHQRDPGDPGAQRRRRTEQQGDVRQRPGGDERHRLRRPRAGARPSAPPPISRRPDRRFRQVGAVEPRIAVELDRDPRLAHSGRSAPAATGTSVRPRRVRTRSALRVVRSSGALPATVVIASSSSSGRASARAIARASSWPGSQSRMIGWWPRRSVAQRVPRGGASRGPRRLPP